MTEFKYLEIVEKATKEVCLRTDVTNQSERQIDRIWGGMSINLNHSEFIIQLTKSETELQKID